MSERTIKFTDKSQISSIYVDTLDLAYARSDCGPKNPNRSPKITTEAFSKSVDDLMNPFSKAIEV
ncbi:MAG: hypothetical protein LBC70_08135 [Chitinispirillales bacterium]|jgi:hypothetical protein|nr:hypothetical protein [Chitinispirillales bacterium]